MANETNETNDAYDEIKRRLSPVLEQINAMDRGDLVSVLDFVMYSLGGRSRCPKDDKTRGCPCVYAAIMTEMLAPYKLGAERATLLEQSYAQVNTQAKRGET
jgi:hypothetical protein